MRENLTRIVFSLSVGSGEGCIYRPKAYAIDLKKSQIPSITLNMISSKNELRHVGKLKRSRIYPLNFVLAVG